VESRIAAATSNKVRILVLDVETANSQLFLTVKRHTRNKRCEGRNAEGKRVNSDVGLWSNRGRLSIRGNNTYERHPQRSAREGKVFPRVWETQ
jgi:hypothetical protein